MRNIFIVLTMIFGLNFLFAEDTLKQTRVDEEQMTAPAEDQNSTTPAVKEKVKAKDQTQVEEDDIEDDSLEDDDDELN